MIRLLVRYSTNTLYRLWRLFLLGLVFLFAHHSVLAENSVDEPLDDERKHYTPEDIANQFGKTHYERVRAQDTFKTRSDNAYLLPSEASVFYRLPDGSTIKGFLLSNNRIAPAYIKGNRVIPGCLDHRWIVHPAEWRQGELICHYPQEILTEIQLSNAVLPDQTQALGGKTESSLVMDESIKSEQAHSKRVSTPPEIDQHAPGQTSALAANVDLEESLQNVKDKAKNIKNTLTKKVDTLLDQGVQTVVEPDPVPDHIYIPPPRVSTSDLAETGMLEAGRKLFGIRKNTWLPVELKRVVSTADRGEVELYLTEDIAGKYRDLPAGSVFYGNALINFGLKRMDVIVSNGSTPDDENFRVSATAHDYSQQYGLLGKLIRDREGELESALGRGAIVAVRDSITPTTGDAGAAVDSVTDDLISNEERYLERAPQAIIQVSPQILYLKVSDEF